MVHRVTMSDNEWQRVTTSDTTSDKEWQWVSTNDNERQREVQRVKKTDNEWKRVTTNYSEWQRVRAVVQWMKTAQYTSKNGWLLLFQWQKEINYYCEGWMAAIRAAK